MYLTVEDRAPGVDEVISALGLDINITKQGMAGTGNKIAGLNYLSDTSLWSAGGTVQQTADLGAQENWQISTRAARVPVVAGPTFDLTGGAVPTGVYRVATITVTTGSYAPGMSFLNSKYCVKNVVNGLKINRAYNGPGPAPELPDLGYLTQATGALSRVTGSGLIANFPEQGSGNGSTPGTTSTQCDAEIHIEVKGDFNGDGVVNSADQAGMNFAISRANTIRVRDFYLGDFNNDNRVDSADQAGLNAYISNL